MASNGRRDSANRSYHISTSTRVYALIIRIKTFFDTSGATGHMSCSSSAVRYRELIHTRVPGARTSPVSVPPARARVGDKPRIIARAFDPPLTLWTPLFPCSWAWSDPHRKVFIHRKEMKKIPCRILQIVPVFRPPTNFNLMNPVELASNQKACASGLSADLNISRVLARLETCSTEPLFI